MKFTDFGPYVQPEAPGCPLFTVERAVREAAIDLCSRSGCWRSEPEPFEIVAGVIDYELPTYNGAEIAHVVDLQRGGVSLRKIGSMTDLYSIIGTDTQAELPFCYSAVDNAAITVARRPAAAETLTLFLSLKPDSTATSIPDAIGKEYRNIIATGAKAMLMLMHSQPWSNPQLGLLNRQLFERHVGTITRQVRFGFSGASIRVRPRSFI